MSICKGFLSPDKIENSITYYSENNLFYITKSPIFILLLLLLFYIFYFIYKYINKVAKIAFILISN